MSNYLSRLIAKQMGSSDGSADSRIIQPRPVARFESAVSSVSQPLSAESLSSSQITSPQPSTRQLEVHHDFVSLQPPINSSLDSLSYLSDNSLQTPQSSQVEAVNHSIQRQSGFPAANFPVPSLSLNIVSPLASSSILPLSQVSPVNPVLKPVLSQPQRFASIQPTLAPVPLPVMPAQPMQMPSLPLLAVSDQRLQERQERLPTALLVSSTLPLPSPFTLSSPSPTPSAVPATIQVTIGRIEVRANSPSPVPSAAPARPVGRMSLEEYLQRRNQGKKP